MNAGERFFVIVEIDASGGADQRITVIGPFPIRVSAESERRRRYFTRHLDSPHNTDRWFSSVVREVGKP